MKIFSGRCNKWLISLTMSASAAALVRLSVRFPASAKETANTLLMRIPASNAATVPMFVLSALRAQSNFASACLTNAEILALQVKRLQNLFVRQRMFLTVVRDMLERNVFCGCFFLFQNIKYNTTHESLKAVAAGCIF